MNSFLQTASGIFLPFLGTAFGAAAVFVFRKSPKAVLQKALLGFASGVMIAASVWSLLIPAIESSQSYGAFSFIPAAVGFLCGVLFLLLLDTIIPHLHYDAEDPEGPRTRLGRTFMLILAVTMHNLPEGMAVGVVFAGLLNGDTAISFPSAMALSFGIALQNLPEGAIISLPLFGEGESKKKSFLYGMLSGIVEPIGALLTLALTSLVSPVLPYLLSFAAGAMLYVVVEELIPQSHEGKHSNVSTISVALGFTLMMILDVALG